MEQNRMEEEVKILSLADDKYKQENLEYTVNEIVAIRHKLNNAKIQYDIDVEEYNRRIQQRLEDYFKGDMPYVRNY